MRIIKVEKKLEFNSPTLLPKGIMIYIVSRRHICHRTSKIIKTFTKWSLGSVINYSIYPNLNVTVSENWRSIIYCFKLRQLQELKVNTGTCIRFIIFHICIYFADLRSALVNLICFYNALTIIVQGTLPFIKALAHFI